MTKSKLKFPLSDVMLSQALTHSSFARANKLSSNERLEYLGDAALELIVSEKLMDIFPVAPEGELSRIRANIVNGKSLAKLAKKWGIDAKIQIMEEKNRTLPSVLADTVEAIIGGIYLENGFETTKVFVLKEFAELFETASSITENEDHKTKLQELLQEKGGSTPKYVVVNETGEAHEKEFTVSVIFNDITLATAKAGNKKQAGQNAAKSALENISKRD